MTTLLTPTRRRNVLSRLAGCPQFGCEVAPLEELPLYCEMGDHDCQFRVFYRYGESLDVESVELVSFDDDTPTPAQRDLYEGALMVDVDERGGLWERIQSLTVDN